MKLSEIVRLAKSSMTFDECVKDKLADPSFEIKNKAKYKTKKEAAEALCAWIGSRTEPGKFKGKGGYGKGRPGYGGKWGK